MKLFSQHYGDGPPLIILHGLFDSSDNWHTLARRFSQNFRVFTLDLRNHGRSPHSEDINYDLMRNDILEFMEEQSLSLIHLMGHSIGR
ncbi:MAG: alpha/beta fold hydrolase [bacterium]